MLPRRYFKATSNGVSKTKETESATIVDSSVIENNTKKTDKNLNNTNNSYNFTSNGSDVGTLADFESIFNTNKV